HDSRNRGGHILDPRKKCQLVEEAMVDCHVEAFTITTEEPVDPGRRAHIRRPSACTAAIRAIYAPTFYGPRLLVKVYHERCSPKAVHRRPKRCCVGYAVIPTAPRATLSRRENHARERKTQMAGVLNNKSPIDIALAAPSKDALS